MNVAQPVVMPTAITSKPSTRPVTTTTPIGDKSRSQTGTTPKAEAPLRFIVGDSFQTNVVDVDGDGKVDVSHGKFVSTLIQAKTAEAGKKAAVEELNVETAGFPAVLDSITAKLKSGVKYDGINLSLSLMMPVFDSKGNATNAVADVTAKNIAGALYPNDAASQSAFVSRVNSTGPTADDAIRIKSLVEQYKPKQTQAYKAMLAEASKRGVPVTVAKGNSADLLNPLAMYEPTISVGSTGKGGAVSGFSSKVGKTDVTARGELNHTKVAGGVDVTGDGKADFSQNSLSGGASTVAGVLGKSYDSVKASAADYQAVANYYSDDKAKAPQVIGKVFDLQKLTGLISEASAKTKQGTQYAQSIRDDFAASSKYLTFTADGQGIVATPVNVEKNRVVVDVTGKGGQNVVASSKGTSWAAPTALVDMAVATSKKGF
jgi:hypothetical protein